jgi:hypothetical protein
MNLPSRSEPYKKNEIKTSPPLFSNFMVTVRTQLWTHYALSLGEDECTIYITITVATGVGDATTPVAYKDHSSTEPMRQYARCHYDS